MKPAAWPQLCKFFLGAVSINFEKRCNHYRLILACMLSGVSRDRPVIVSWSTAPRGQVIEESLGQLPKKLAAGPRVLARTESLRTQSGTKQGGPPHDHWAKLGQLRYTRSQYAFIVIALFAMKFIAPASRKIALKEGSGWVLRLPRGRDGANPKQGWGVSRRPTAQSNIDRTRKGPAHPPDHGPRPSALGQSGQGAHRRR